MSYRIAEALDSLRTEINTAAPKRSKKSDGWVGDTAHQSNGSGSDHNPWIKDAKGVGVVRAIDVTHDPRGGMDGAVLAESIRQLGKKGDARLRNGGYVIYNRRIASAVKGWAWRKYKGSNPHDKHVHISVSKSQSAFDKAGTWGVAVKKSAAKPKTHTVAKGETLAKIAAKYKLTVKTLQTWNGLKDPKFLRVGQVLRLTAPPAKPPAPATPKPVPVRYLGRRVLRKGAAGNDVTELQKLLNRHGARLKVDGDFGYLTATAVREFQKKKGLKVDGVVGPKTVSALRK